MKGATACPPKAGQPWHPGKPWHPGTPLGSASLAKTRYASAVKARNAQSLLILLGLVLGGLVGQWFLFDPATGFGIPADHWTKTAGDIVLMRPLKLMIIPIVLVGIVVGVTSIGDPAKVGVVGGATVLYFITTMLIAAVIGAALVTTFNAGNVDAETRTVLVQGALQNYEASDVRADIDLARTQKTTSLGEAFLTFLRQVVPESAVAEMAAGRTLGVIVFALLLGLALAAGGETTAPAVRFFEALFDGILRLVQWLVWLAPAGVFFLAAWTVGRIGFADLVGPLGKYVGVVVAGLVLHGMVVLPAVLFLFSRGNPFRFLWQMKRALMTAFGTASSSAALPVTVECAQSEGGCSRRAANVVLPLGSTLNMDGTALFEAVAVVFLFQLYGIELEFGQLLVVVITATLAAIGTAGIPSAGLVMMVIVINAVNTSLGGSAEPLPLEAIGVIIGVDRLVDMCRTTVNVWGDAVGAKIITKLAPD